MILTLTPIEIQALGLRDPHYPPQRGKTRIGRDGAGALFVYVGAGVWAAVGSLGEAQARLTEPPDMA